MGFFSSLLKSVAQVAGSATLKGAYLDKKAPNMPGVYKVFYQGQLMKVGKASDGLRKRFSDYYRGRSGGTAGLKYITEENRDSIRVSWLVCPTSKTRALEEKWYDVAKDNGEELPWSDRR